MRLTDQRAPAGTEPCLVLDPIARRQLANAHKQSLLVNQPPFDSWLRRVRYALQFLLDVRHTMDADLAALRK